MKKITVLLLILAIAVPLALLKMEQRDRRYIIRQAGRITYIPKPEALKHMSLGYESVMGDLIWVRAIQYYGSHFSSMRRHPEDWQRLADALLELRPHFIKGLVFVGVAMAEGARQPEEAIDYMNKALERNPGAYELPYNAAMFAAMTLQDKQLAAEYMCRASETDRVIPAHIAVADVASVSTASPFETQLYPRMDFRPSRIVAPPDTEFTVNLWIAGAQAASTMEYNITWDPDVLAIEGVLPPEINATIHPASGLIEVRHVYEEGVRESALLSLRARSRGAGETFLDVEPLNIRRWRDGWFLDIAAPRHLARLCNAYRTQTGEWFLALHELSKQYEAAHLDVERENILSHVNRILVEIDTKVFNHALAAWVDARGKAPETLEEMRTDPEIRRFLIDLSLQVQRIVNTLYLDKHPETNPSELPFQVWQDPDLGPQIFREYPMLWDRLSPFFEWWYGRQPKDPETTDEDVPLMGNILRDIYDIGLILDYRYRNALQMAPTPQDLIERGFEVLREPNRLRADKPEDREYEYRLVTVKGVPVVRSTYEMYKERQDILTTLNQAMSTIRQRYEADPENNRLPDDINDFFTFGTNVQYLDLVDPFGEAFVIDPDTYEIVTEDILEDRRREAAAAREEDTQ